MVEYLEAAQDAKGDMDWKKNNEINNECAKWYFDLSHDDQMAVNDAADAWQKANKKSLSSFLKRCLRGYKGLEQCLSHREEDPVSYQMSNF